MDAPSIRQFAARLHIQLVTQFGGREKANGWIDGHCPLAPWRHQSGRDATPSFGILIADDGISHYKCFTCGKGTFSQLAVELGKHRGDQQALFRIAYEIDEVEQRAILAKPIPDYEDILGGAVAVSERAGAVVLDQQSNFRRFRSVVRYPHAMRYLAGRGISLAAALAMELRYHEQAHRIMFPVRDRYQRLRGFVGRIIDDSLIAPKNPKSRDYAGLQKQDLLLGEDMVARGAPFHLTKKFPAWTRQAIIAVEGPTDRARLLTYGYRRVVSLLGSSVTFGKMMTLEEWGYPVIWLTDNDQAGRTCLYGPYDSVLGEYTDPEAGVLSRLYGMLPMMTTEYPEDSEAGADPGSLPEDVIDDMIRSATLYLKEPPRDRRRP